MGLGFEGASAPRIWVCCMFCQDILCAMWLLPSLEDYSILMLSSQDGTEHRN